MPPKFMGNNSGAHQNTIETITLILSATLIAGIKYPICAALFCGSMTLSRIAYTLGYSSGVPEKVRMSCELS